MTYTEDEPRILLGRYEDDILEIREGIKRIDNESFEGYQHLRKIIFPASLEEIEENAIDEQEELEELDFSRVTKLKEIPNSMVYCETKISKFVIPEGVTKVGEYFLYEAKADTEIYIPSSVKKMEAINGNNNNDLIVYLFAHDIDIEDMEQDIKTLYVLPQDYANYANKLKECDSEACLREIPEKLLNFYSMCGVSTSLTNETSQNQSRTTTKDTNHIYSEKLEALIKNILADGEITEKERVVLHNCAETEGVDADEIDVYIDGELDKIHNEQQKAKAQVRKCPACGEIIPILSRICPLCGNAVDDKETGNLQELIQSIENNLVSVKEILSSFQNGIGYFDIFFSNRDKEYVGKRATFEKDIRKARVYYGEDKKVQLLINELEEELNVVEKYYNKYQKRKKIAKTIALILFFLPTIFQMISTIVSPPKYGVWEGLTEDLIFVGPFTLGFGAILALISYKAIINGIK